jgi:hypothetical protein
VALAAGPDADAERLTLRFGDHEEAARWLEQLQRRSALAADLPACDGHRPPGVSLVRRANEAPHVVLGRLEFTGPTGWVADRALQLRAAMWGADAVIDVYRRRCPELGWGARQVSGVAIQVEDPDDRKRMQLKFYSEEVLAQVKRMALLVVSQAALLFLSVVFCTGKTSLQVPTGEKLSEALESACWGVAIISGWPMLLLVLLGTLRWPGLLRPTALAVLAITAGRVIMIRFAHLQAMHTAGADFDKSGLAVLFDPVDWAFAIIGIVSFLQVNRLAGDARYLLPPEMKAVPAGRAVATRGVFAATLLGAVVFLGFVAVSRYEDSVYLLQPGVDVRREQEGLLTLNEGVEQFKRGDMAAAERSWNTSLQQWEKLTSTPTSPLRYKANLAQTAYNLGLLCERQNRPADALKLYERVVALAPLLEQDQQISTPQFRLTLTDARQAVDELRRGAGQHRP